MSVWTPGQSAVFRKTIAECDVYGMAGISGDFNPVHVDAVAAAGTRFGGRVAHGVLLLSFVSNVLGMRLPGPGCILLKLESAFTHPAYIGDTVEVRVEVAEVQGNRLTLSFECSNQHGVRLAHGTALVSVPRTAV